MKRKPGQPHKGWKGAARKKLEGRHVCKCECGGEVRGIEQFDRLWTWCEKCSPVVNVPVSPEW